MTETQTLQTASAFTEYLHVVNRALGAHRDETPYKQMLALGEKALGDSTIGVAVYKDDASKPHDWFTVRFSDGKFALEEHGKKPERDFDWKLAREHVDNVIEKPQEFVEKPWKLDLDWLKTRVGVS